MCGKKSINKIYNEWTHFDELALILLKKILLIFSYFFFIYSYPYVILNSVQNLNLGK